MACGRSHWRWEPCRTNLAAHHATVTEAAVDHAGPKAAELPKREAVHQRIAKRPDANIEPAPARHDERPDIRRQPASMTACSPFAARAHFRGHKQRSLTKAGGVVRRDRAEIRRL